MDFNKPLPVNPTVVNIRNGPQDPNAQDDPVQTITQGTKYLRMSIQWAISLPWHYNTSDKNSRPVSLSCTAGNRWLSNRSSRPEWWHDNQLLWSRRCKSGTNSLKKLLDELHKLDNVFDEATKNHSNYGDNFDPKEKARPYRSLKIIHFQQSRNPSACWLWPSWCSQRDVIRIIIPRRRRWRGGQKILTVWFSTVLIVPEFNLRSVSCKRLSLRVL